MWYLATRESHIRKRDNDMNKRVAAAAALTLTATAGVFVTSGVASAHHPEVDVVTDCTDDGWTATFTIYADAVRGYVWNIEGGGLGGAVPDAQPFTRTIHSGLDEDTATYFSGQSNWWQSTSSRQPVATHGGVTATAYRPDDCVPPPPPLVEVTPVAPNVVTPTCDAPGSVTPAETEGVTYELVDTGFGTMTVLANFLPGYTWADPTLARTVIFGPYDVAQLDGEQCTPPTEPTVPPTEPTVPPTDPTVPDTEPPTVPPTEPTTPDTEPPVTPPSSTPDTVAPNPSVPEVPVTNPPATPPAQEFVLPQTL